MNTPTSFSTTFTDPYDSDSNQSIEIPNIPLIVTDSSLDPCLSKKDSTSKQNGKITVSRSHRVTTIQEYTQLVISSMKKHKKMNTTEVAKTILGSVHPKTNKLTVNIRRRVGDALSVLTAINLVEKHANGYVWIGDNDKREEMATLHNEIEELQNKLILKQQQLKSLQLKELELRKQNIQVSKPSPVESSPLSKSTVCTPLFDFDSFFDSDHTEMLEAHSPTSIHFNEGFDDDLLQTFPPLPRFPSISLPGFTMENIPELTTIN